jgi:sugar/nucleoside kinase (ribokinase family)
MFQKKLQVLCIGSISLDLFFPTDEGIIIETPDDITSQKKLAFELGGKILAPELHTAIGGVAANVSQGLAKLGIQAASYSCIGDDSNGEFCLKALKKNGVQTKYVESLPDAKTDLSAIIVLIPTGERTIIHNRDANKKLLVQSKDLIAPWVFISALNGDWQKNIETVLHAQKYSSGKKFQIAFNPGQHNIKEESGLIFQVIRSADFLVLNKDEAIELVLSRDPDCEASSLENEVYLLKTLYQAGAKIIALTDGIRGAWVYNGSDFWFLQTPKSTKVVETTGAGDAFTSGFFGALLLGKPIDECLRFGMANSQAVIQDYGGSAMLRTRAEIENDILHLIPQELH